MLTLSGLSTSDLAGQFLWIGFEGTTFSPALESLLDRVRPGGVILFGRNIESPRQVRALTDALFRSLAIPPFLALDQEGGRVNRLLPILGPTPAPHALASRARPAEAIRRQSTATSLALKSLGFNVNFAPVLDLSGPDGRNGIGDRSFGEDPGRVADLAGLFAKEHLRAGVIPVGKHFPGLGSASADSHLTLPVIRRSRRLLLDRDLLPYRRLRRLLPIVMVGHAYYPALQGRRPQPATLSRKAIALLRRIGFRGLVLTDDLEMGAIDAAMDSGRVALAALEAGNDALMFCRSEDKILAAHEAVERSLTGRPAANLRLRMSLRRTLALKERCLVRRRRGRFSLGSVARSRLLLESLGPGAAGADPTARA